MSDANIGENQEDVEAAGRVFTKITEALAALLGRPSRWTGQLEFTTNPFVSGIAHLDGRIEITYAVWSHPSFRWRTLIHEALHLFSPSYTKQQYSMARGWEEGVVEQTQRLLRQQVLGAVGIQLSEDVFRERDAQHEYNGYIEALEKLRALLNMESFEFYTWLLSVALPERLSVMQSRIAALPETSRSSARLTLMLAQGKLGRG